MEPAKPSRSAAEKKILAFFSEATKAKLAEKGNHPAMRILRTKNGPKLETYIAQGARKTTGMHILRRGAIHVVMGDALKARDSYYPEAPPLGGRQHDPGGLDIKYFVASSPRDVVGTIADIRAWFEAHGDEFLVIPQSDVTHEDDDLPVAEGYYETNTLTAEVRLLSWLKPDDKDYVDLGGVGTAAVSALKQAIGIAASGVGNVFGGEGPGHTAVEAGHAGHHGAEVREHLGRESAGKPGAFKWNRALAAEHLEWAVTLREGQGSKRKGYSAEHLWTLAPRDMINDAGRRVAWPAISLHEVSTVVLGNLIPKAFDRLDADAE